MFSSNSSEVEIVEGYRVSSNGGASRRFRSMDAAKNWASTDCKDTEHDYCIVAATFIVPRGRGHLIE